MKGHSDGYEDVVNAMWGFQEQKSRNGHASFVVMEDALIEGDVIAEIRDGVSINRNWGTSAEQLRYDRAILPRGAKIKLSMILEVGSELDKNWAEFQAAFADLLHALKNGEIRLGAAKTRGLGRVKLVTVTALKYDFLTSKGILKTLRGERNNVLGELLSGNRATVLIKPRLSIEIKWEPQGPIMVKAEGDGIAVDTLPLVSAVDNSLTFVIPGSSIKGALRTQAERIVRTICSWEASEEASQQLDLPLIKNLFGTPASSKENQFGIGSLFVDDCYANLPITPDAWGKIEAATDESELRQALNQAKLQNTQQAFHVAVDRWTGGAADSFLYSTLEPMGVKWQPIRLTLELNRFKENQLPGICLLLLVLRDLIDGRISLGYGTNRGMGAIKVNNIEINCQGLDDSLAALAEITISEGKLAVPSSGLLDNLNHAWTQWIDASMIGDA